jgi:AcrR family transcriptional regulator
MDTGQAREDRSTDGRFADARPERRIRGRTLAERRSERREAMLAAGLELFGTKGYAATTVEEVCRRAFVSSRNFYEEFDNRLDLLVALGERIIAGAFAAWSEPGAPADLTSPDPVLLSVGRIRARVSSLVHTLVDDPRIARIAFIETVGIDPAHEAIRRKLLGVFPAWLQTYLADHLDARGISRSRQRSLTVGVFGAAYELIMDWALQPPDTRPTVDDLIDDIVELGQLVLQLPEEDDTGEVAGTG